MDIINTVASVIAAACSLLALLIAVGFKSQLASLWYLVFPCFAGPKLKRLRADIVHLQNQLVADLVGGLSNEDRKKLVDDLRVLRIFPRHLRSDSRNAPGHQKLELEYLRRAFASWRYLRMARRKFSFGAIPTDVDFDTDHLKLWTRRHWRRITGKW